MTAAMGSLAPTETEYMWGRRVCHLRPGGGRR